jgi:nucleotide-binding universal stress UspA family protein
VQSDRLVQLAEAQARTQPSRQHSAGSRPVSSIRDLELRQRSPDEAPVRMGRGREAPGAPTIVIGFDGSDRARDALALGRVLGELTDARLVTVSGYGRDLYKMLPRPNGWSSQPRRAAQAAREAESLLRGAPGSSSLMLGARSPARALRDIAAREHADLIVVGCGARSPRGGVVPGSVAKRLLRAAPCAVALAPVGFAQTRGAPAPVGVAFDGSWESRVALAAAARLASAQDCELRAISVFMPPSAALPVFAFTSYRRYLERLRAERRARLQAAIDSLAPGVEVEPIVAEGEPARLLADRAQGLGLLVMGSRDHGPIRRVVRGGVSHKLLERLACSAIIIPRRATRALGWLQQPPPNSTAGRPTATSRHA